MRVRSLIAAAALTLLPAVAQAQVLTFEGLANGSQVGDFYNGGAGGNLGIVFSPASLALISEAAGGDGNFQGNPSGNTVLFFATGGAATMDVAAGFTTGFSFYYSAIGAHGSIDVWSGLDGTGSLLATLTLPVTPQGPYGSPPCPDGAGSGAYCPWVPIGVAFAGTAESVDFAGSAIYIAFDDVTLDSATPGGGGSVTPEPATMSLMATGLVGLAGVTRRRRRKTV